MALECRHFDTRTNEWLKDKHGDLIIEQLENTLLEKLIPGEKFDIGHVDLYSQVEDLYNHPEGKRLILASGDRLIYGSDRAKEIAAKIFPDVKDRCAYASILLGECKSPIDRPLSILVVDDKTGENGGIIDNRVALNLTGDCYGQIDYRLVEKTDEKYPIIQHRLGWLPNPEEYENGDRQYRIAKGTLKPCHLLNLERKNDVKIDAIVPLSSFKGTDKDNPNGAVKPQIEPGLYYQPMWLGEKARSQPGKNAISQILPSFPEAMSDYLELLQDKATKLAETAADARTVARYYCEMSEKTRKFPDAEADKTDLERESNIYRIIRADVDSGHYQLLETPAVQRELAKFLKKRWNDIATGYDLKFDRGTIIPSPHLKDGEICVPWMKEGEEVLSFRSPFLNSNGMCVGTNKWVPEIMGPNGKALTGAIAVSAETLKQLQARNPEARETECERQARDFDGDCIAVALAKDWPALTASAKERNELENAYEPTPKLAKISFYTGDGKQPPLEEIALERASTILVGQINNAVTKFICLESEARVMKDKGDWQQQKDYLAKVTDCYQKILQEGECEEFQDILTQIVDLSQYEAQDNLKFAIDLNRSLYKKIIEKCCYQNQIAVDMPKSARMPDLGEIKAYEKYLYRDVGYITDKKLSHVYIEKPIVASGVSPVEIAINQTNQYFTPLSQLARDFHEFNQFFEDIKFNQSELLETAKVKAEFDEAFAEASETARRAKTEVGPRIILSGGERELELVNCIKYKSDEIWKKVGQELTIRLFEKNGTAFAFDTKTKKTIGEVICEGKVHQDNLTVKIARVLPQLTLNASSILFDRARSIADSYRQGKDSEKLQSLAAASWQLSTKKTVGENRQGANFAIWAFAPEITQRLSEYRFKSLEITRIQNSVSGMSNLHVRPGLADKREIWAGDLLIGEIGNHSYNLPVGTELSGQLIPSNSFTATGRAGEVEFKINELKNGDYFGRIFDNEQIELKIEVRAVGEKLSLLKAGKKIGTIDRTSWEEANLPLTKSNRLELTLEGIGNTRDEKGGGFVIATSENGKRLKIENIAYGEYAEAKFKGETLHQLEVKVEPGTRKHVAILDRQVLGVIQQIKDREALQKAGLYQKPTPCAINSNFFELKLEIDPASLKYHSIPVKPELNQEFVNPASIAIARKVIERPSLLVETSDGSVLAIDSRHRAETESYLTGVGTAFTEIESTRGYTTYKIDKPEAIASRYLRSDRSLAEILADYPRRPQPEALETVAVWREKWEENLIATATERLKARTSIPLGKQHYLTRNSIDEAIAIVTVGGETLYKTKLDEPATINSLSQIQKSYWEAESMPQKSWEKILVAEAMLTLKGKDKATFGKYHLVSLKSDTLTISNHFNEIVYQARLGRTAEIDKLPDEVKEHYQDKARQKQKVA